MIKGFKYFLMASTTFVSFVSDNTQSMNDREHQSTEFREGQRATSMSLLKAMDERSIKNGINRNAE